MNFSKDNPLRKPGILVVLIILALTVVSCGSDDPVAPTPPPGNRAPGAPTIDTAAGAPADGAVDVPTSMTLTWKCTDPDKDVLSYTVHFGPTDTPAAVSTDQAGTSYGPVSMVHNTTFYWQIIAKDPDGETTASPVWSFTTVVTGVEGVSIPSTPTGSATGETGESLLFSATGAVSSQGHAVEYQFSWGDGGDNSVFMNGTDAAHSWVAAGTYDVTARARCIVHPGTMSAWSAAFTVTITDPAVETVGTPDTPSGPATGETTESLAFTTSVVTSSLGHSVAYTFDWGDGTDTTMGVNQANHTWTVAGTYEIKVMAFCALHPEIISPWSPTTQVTITVPGETISPPQIPTTIADVTGVGEEEWVTCYVTYSNLGHDLEYRFDLENDGTFTAWSTNRTLFYTWLTAGTYTIRAQARCIEHPSAVSDWTTDTYAHDIVVNDGAETISTPAMLPAGEVEYKVGDTWVYGTSGATSSLGHPVQYQIEWGDGETSTWGSPDRSYAYLAVGTYEARVRARCIEHPDIISEWSAPTIVTIIENITQPTINGPSVGIVGNPITFTTSGSTSSEGHDLEYRLLVGTSSGSLGDPQPWTTMDNLIHTFPYARVWYVRVQARCIADLTEGGASLPHYISISAK